MSLNRRRRALGEPGKLPPLSAAAKAEIAAKIGPVTGDGNPLDAWGLGGSSAGLLAIDRLARL